MLHSQLDPPPTHEQEGAIEDLSELRSDAEEGGSSGSDDEELEALEAEWRRRRGER